MTTDWKRKTAYEIKYIFKYTICGVCVYTSA